MNINHEQFGQLVNLLADYFPHQNARMAILEEAFCDKRKLYHDIQFDGSANDFVPNMLNKIMGLDPDAMYLLFDAVRKRAGLAFDQELSRILGLTDIPINVSSQLPKEDRQHLLAPAGTDPANPANLLQRGHDEIYEHALKLQKFGHYDEALKLYQHLKEADYNVPMILLKIHACKATLEYRQLMKEWEHAANWAQRRLVLQQGRTFRKRFPGFPDEANLFLPSIQFVNDPFFWVYIPEGPATLRSEPSWNNYIPKSTSCTKQIPEFYISKYPVTNRQFRQFIDEQGYEIREFWTAQGWQVRENIHWEHPIIESGFDADDQPVVNVSWYEAVAYCQWLSERTGDKISLPTEWQWQRAAAGNTNREYAYGHLHRIDCANTRENLIPKTTVVHHYDGQDNCGHSEFGVADMSGNIWEWCLTERYRGEDVLELRDVMRSVRGGCWNSAYHPFSCTWYRQWSYPYERLNTIGFRIVLTPH